VSAESLVELSWDPSRLQMDRVIAALRASYWSPNIRPELVERAAASSLTLGAYDQASGEQLGYARVITDRATFAYLCDVITFEGHRGRGIGKRLVEAVLAHPDLQTVRRFALATRDAHSLYARYGFSPVVATNWLERKSDASAWQDVIDGADGRAV
jgi:GNAT superfamily N-acetyltransferase